MTFYAQVQGSEQVVMQNPRMAAYLFVLSLLCLAHFAGCGTVKSVVPGMGDANPPEGSAGGRQHLPVSPEEAVAFLREVAPQHGWEVISSGDEFDMSGPRGKYFRLETDRFVGGRKSVSGVFYSEPTGTYVPISDKNGLPEALVEPLIAAIKAGRTTDGGP
jgi:hypothetical protein